MEAGDNVHEVNIISIFDFIEYYFTAKITAVLDALGKKESIFSVKSSKNIVKKQKKTDKKQIAHI